MSGMPDDWGDGGRAVRQSDGRRPRRSDGRHVRARRPEDEQSPEASLPVSDLDEDDPKTLAEDAQWAAKLRPGRAPSAAEAGAATGGGDQAPPAPSGEPWAAAPAAAAPSTGGDPWESSPSDGTGEVWGSSPTVDDDTPDPWAMPPSPAGTTGDDLWGASPAAGASTGDWTASNSAFEPQRSTFDWGLGEPPAPAPPPVDSGTGSWAGGAGTSPTWQPDAGAWSPEPSPRPSWETEPPAAPSAGQPFPAAPEPPSARPWEAPSPLPPEPAAPITDPSASTGSDFGELFAELARDRQAAPPPTPTPAADDASPRRDDQAVVQAAHAEARRLIEEATGQWLWDDDKHPAADEIAAPATGYGSAAAQGLPQPGPAAGGGAGPGAGYGSPTAFGPGGQAPGATPGGYGAAQPTGPASGHGTPASFGTPGWGDPLPPPPVPDGAAPFGAAASFAPPGSAPAEVGPSATPPPLGRDLTPTRDPGRHEASADSGSPLWAPDRRAGEDDTGGVGWLWSVEEHGASPPVPGSWLREPPRPQAREVDGLSRSIEGRRLRQLEGRGQGRRVRHARRWPFRVAVASWVVLFAVVCWLYVFPWLEGILPENF